MDVLTDMLSLTDSPNDLIGQILRVGGHKAHAPDTRHRIQLPQELCKSCLLVILAVGVDILPQQGDLPVAICHDLLHLMQDILRQTAALAASHIGHDAVGTKIIATVHDGHPGRNRTPSHRRCFAFIRQLSFAQDYIDNVLTPDFQFPHHLGQPMHFIRAQHEINMGCPSQQGFAFLLGHTAGNAENQLRPLALQALDLANLAIDLVLGRLPHAAGIQQD